MATYSGYTFNNLSRIGLDDYTKHTEHNDNPHVISYALGVINYSPREHL